MSVRPLKAPTPGYVDLDEARDRARKFIVERWRDIRFKAVDEWLVTHVLPRCGLAAIYGRPRACLHLTGERIGIGRGTFCVFIREGFPNQQMSDS